MLSAFEDEEYAELLQKEFNSETYQERNDRELAIELAQEERDSELARKLTQEERDNELARELEREERDDELARELARELEERDNELVEYVREEHNNGDNRTDEEFEALVQRIADSTFEEPEVEIIQPEYDIACAFSNMQTEHCRIVWDRIKYLVAIHIIPMDILRVIVIKMINIGCLIELQDCNACLLEIEPDTEYAIAKCHHSYHIECILRIFETRFNCPMCKICLR